MGFGSSFSLRAHYPREYMVATVNNGGGFYSQELYLHEAKMHGATINLPCVNRSDGGATIFGKDIFIGLGMIAGFELETMKQLLMERHRNGAFQDLRDVVKRVPISLEQLRILIRIGALRFTGLDKKALLWDAHFLLGHTKVSRPEKKLFDADVKEFRLPELWYHELENAYDEIELLGFPVTISPFDLIDRTGLLGGLSRSDARAVEQALIEVHGLGKNGGTLLNRINSIALTNRTYSQQLQRGYELLQSIGYR